MFYAVLGRCQIASYRNLLFCVSDNNEVLFTFDKGEAFCSQGAHSGPFLFIQLWINFCTLNFSNYINCVKPRLFILPWPIIFTCNVYSLHLSKFYFVTFQVDVIFWSMEKFQSYFHFPCFSVILMRLECACNVFKLLDMWFSS